MSNLYPPGCNGTPYDDELDAVDEAEKFIKRFDTVEDDDIQLAIAIIQGLLEIIDDLEMPDE